MKRMHLLIFGFLVLLVLPNCMGTNGVESLDLQNNLYGGTEAGNPPGSHEPPVEDPRDHEDPDCLDHPENCPEVDTQAPVDPEGGLNPLELNGEAEEDSERDILHRM